MVRPVYEKHPDVTDEELGIRAFHIKKAKAAERAIERLRHGLGSDWSQLTDDEIEELEWVFGELWAYAARADWDHLRFSQLTMRDTMKILTLGSQLRRHARPAVDVLREVRTLVQEAGTGAPDQALADEGAEAGTGADEASG